MLPNARSWCKRATDFGAVVWGGGGFYKVKGKNFLNCFFGVWGGGVENVGEKN